MQQPVMPDGILDRRARKPLDFEPGTEWQYSNTNYVVAGRIVEKVTGMPVFVFLRSRILNPLGMTSAIDLDQQLLTVADAAGYTRFGLAPVRPVAPEARGWLYAAGELAVTARDLALWDQALLEGRLLKPSSLNEMITPVRLKNGAPPAMVWAWAPRTQVDIRSSSTEAQCQASSAITPYGSIKALPWWC